jgi:hypothetical protein
MRSGTQATTLRGLPLRAAAVFLLLLVCADVFIPQVCCTGPEGREATDATVTADCDGLTTAALSDGDTAPAPDRPTDPSPCDDCFCCARVTTTASVTVVPSPPDQKIAPPFPSDAWLPTSHPQAAFHPPRLA